MGFLTVRSDKPAIDLIVGIGVFILDSLVALAVLFGMLSQISRCSP